jgi:hypothetical protein
MRHNAVLKNLIHLKILNAFLLKLNLEKVENQIRLFSFIFLINQTFVYGLKLSPHFVILISPHIFLNDHQKLLNSS